MSRVTTTWLFALLCAVASSTASAALPERIAFSASGRARGWHIYTVTPDGLSVRR
ncbi:hypothetical protein HN371_03570 [Candidatus Poribacteria bacterium]|jgi:hypothetical protein|nr:hypothetical protein [Candidatus Poribacteria bacterium]MBT5714980.1 hypothetical protein [Candidatus Poribacteria bacterium]MBT7100082.1 hypothetical protein [Candidatus Poribacteria bacterium]MBT7804028.1 hypothetical protein [Candidatus Poribacteria bacterium]